MPPDPAKHAPDPRLPLEVFRWVIVAITGGMFLTAAVMLGPRSSRATDRGSATPRATDLGSAKSVPHDARANPNRRFLGELRGRDYTVRIDLTPDGTRYTVHKNGLLAGRDLSGEELASSFPDLDVAGMEANPDGGGALMLADPADDH